MRTSQSGSGRTDLLCRGLIQTREPLPPRIADRVLAVLARKHLPLELMGLEVKPTKAD